MVALQVGRWLLCLAALVVWGSWRGRRRCPPRRGLHQPRWWLRSCRAGRCWRWRWRRRWRRLVTLLLLLELGLLLCVEKLRLQWRRRLLLVLLRLAPAAARLCRRRRRLLQVCLLRALEDAAEHVLHDVMHERV